MTHAWRRFAVLLAAAALVVLFTTFYPYRQLRATRTDLDRAHATVEQVEKERAALEQRANQLRQPSEIERLAREQFGLAQPGEVAYVVVPDDGAPAQAPGAR